MSTQLKILIKKKKKKEKEDEASLTENTTKRQNCKLPQTKIRKLE
jgi:hypothetical protein